MSLNPYAPPQSDVADVVSPLALGTEKPIFFPVSQTKLLVLSLCTLGLYQYYWFYKNWRIIRERTGEDASPFWRAFFAVFYCYKLFAQIRKHSFESSASSLPAGALATVWIVLSLLYRLPDPYSLVYLFAILALLPVQAAINAINTIESPKHDPNARFTAWNWVTVVLGGLFLLAAVYGTFLPAHQETPGKSSGKPLVR